MGAGDRATRAQAIPFYANVWGYNRSVWSDQSITTFSGSVGLSTSVLGDLHNFRSGGTLSTVNAIRVNHPYYGGLISCDLNLRFTLAVAESSRQFRVAIGTFGSNYAANTSYSESYINTSHKLITGRDQPYTISAAGTFNQPRLNLMPALYPRGHAEYVDDGFVILLVFDAAPSTGSGWDFNKFEMHCTAAVGLK